MTLGNTLQWNFNQNTKLFIHKNACENILCEIAVILSRGRQVNWLSPSDTYIHQLIGSTLANVMFCCLFGVKPLPEQMMTHCKLDSQQINFSKISIKLFFSIPNFKCIYTPWCKRTINTVWRSTFLAYFADSFVHMRCWEIRRGRKHNNDIIWMVRHLKSQVTRLFVQPLVLADIKKTPKLHIAGPLW